MPSHVKITLFYMCKFRIFSTALFFGTKYGILHNLINAFCCFWCEASLCIIHLEDYILKLS